MFARRARRDFRRRRRRRRICRITSGGGSSRRAFDGRFRRAPADATSVSRAPLGCCARARALALNWPQLTCVRLCCGRTSNVAKDDDDDDDNQRARRQPPQKAPTSNGACFDTSGARPKRASVIFSGPTFCLRPLVKSFVVVVVVVAVCLSRARAPELSGRLFRRSLTHLARRLRLRLRSRFVQLRAASKCARKHMLERRRTN